MTTEGMGVMVRIDDDRQVSDPVTSVAEYLLSGSKADDLDLERDRSLPREVDLDGLT